VDKPNVAIALPDDVEGARVVISRGRRIARDLGLEWIALRVLPAGSRSEARSGRSDLGELVSALGGRLVLAQARDVARAIIELSEREHVRLLVIGRSRRSRFLRRLRRGTTERLLRERRPFDVVIAAEGAGR
jgi:K+-sensing histidine kinase KdpD